MKLHHKLLPILIIPISLFLFIHFGWNAYSIITERGGLNGNSFIYYDVSKLQSSIYATFVSLAGLFFIIMIIHNFIQQNAERQTKTFWWFLIFIGLLALCSVYLKARFIGKG